VARGLRRAVVGSRIAAARCHYPPAVGGDACRFDRLVRGRTLEAIERHGKYLFLRLSGGAWLALHLRMTGQFYLLPRRARPDGSR